MLDIAILVVVIVILGLFIYKVFFYGKTRETHVPADYFHSSNKP